MTIRIVRLGTERGLNEGLRIGTVRRPPRGVKKEDFARKNYYDLWFPNLAPSANLLKKHFPIDSEKTWSAFKRGFLREMTMDRPINALQALAKDGVVPRVFGKGSGPTKEPRNGILFTFVLEGSMTLTGQGAAPCGM